MLDSGIFTLYLRGARIGEERFLIRQEGGGGGGAGPIYRAGAELNLKLDGRTQRISVALEALGANGRPRRYEAEINGAEATSIVGAAVRDRIRFDIRSPAGDVMKEFLLRGPAIIVERQIAHHYFFVWKLLAGNPSVEATVFVPRDGKQERVTIEDLGSEPVRLNDHELPLRHVVMRTETGATHHIWLDGHRVMKVEVPQDEFTAIRTDGESR